MSVCMYMCMSVSSVFAQKSSTDGWIMMILTYIVDIDETLKLTQSQGHKVKGQVHIGINVKK